ncbi:hypothetical protein IHE44_0012736, partial [Lamprotornis superbus]
VGIRHRGQRVPDEKVGNGNWELLSQEFLEWVGKEPPERILIPDFLPMDTEPKGFGICRARKESSVTPGIIPLSVGCEENQFRLFPEPEEPFPTETPGRGPETPETAASQHRRNGGVGFPFPEIPFPSH